MRILIPVRRGALATATPNDSDVTSSDIESMPPTERYPSFPSPSFPSHGSSLRVPSAAASPQPG
eukprot:6390541-Prymnesium_polylepis.1